VFSILQIESGITLEDSPELTKKLWRFMLKTSNVKRNGGTKGFPFLSSKKAFIVGLFPRSMGIRFIHGSVIFVGFSTDFKDCNMKSFYEVT